MVRETTSADSGRRFKLLFRGEAELETGGKRYANKRGSRLLAGDTRAN